MTIEEKLKILPESPGVYLMYDQAGQVIYVGKAKVLKNRVRQYFGSSLKLPKVQAMVDNVRDFGYILTLSEKDALSLEANLVRKYNPRYNILLKDDKHSPYIKIDLREEYPTIEVTRKLTKDGARYFGPYFHGIRVWDIVDIIRSAYKVRACPKKFPKRECLHYHLDMCSAPCTGRISKQEYDKAIAKTAAFLAGKDDEAEKLLNKRMTDAVEAEEFERAIEYRDRLKMLQLLQDRSISGGEIKTDLDSIAILSDGLYGAITVNIVRGNKMMGIKNFAVADAALSGGGTLESFITQYYSLNNEIPDEVLVSVEFDTTALKEYLSALKGSAVTVSVPKIGIKKRLIDMAEKNAAEYLYNSVEKIKHKEDMTKGAADRLKEILGLKSVRRIECYDISNISGVDKVASGVVFIDGEPSKQDYRRYRIKTVEGADDFASLREVLSRRLKGDIPPPDLLVIDGGKGQLSAVAGVLKELDLDVSLISLAEKEELIYTTHSSDPIALSKSDYALRLLQRIRDEAHRFAITYHRTLRSRRMDSELLSIPGIGAKKRAKLLQHLTYKEIKTLPATEIAKRSGIDIASAKKIEQHYKDKEEVIKNKG